MPRNLKKNMTLMTTLVALSLAGTVVPEPAVADQGATMEQGKAIAEGMAAAGKAAAPYMKKGVSALGSGLSSALDALTGPAMFEQESKELMKKMVTDARAASDEARKINEKIELLTYEENADEDVERWASAGKRDMLLAHAHADQAASEETPNGAEYHKEQAEKYRDKVTKAQEEIERALAEASEKKQTWKNMAATAKLMKEINEMEEEGLKAYGNIVLVFNELLNYYDEAKQWVKRVYKEEGKLDRKVDFFFYPVKISYLEVNDSSKVPSRAWFMASSRLQKKRREAKEAAEMGLVKKVKVARDEVWKEKRFLVDTEEEIGNLEIRSRNALNHLKDRVEALQKHPGIYEKMDSPRSNVDNVEDLRR